MLNALKKLNAPDSLIEAYKHQYQLLGLMPGGPNATPSGGAPTAGGGSPMPGGCDPNATPSGGTPTPSGGAPTPGGSDPNATPSGGGAPTPGGSDPNSTPSGGGGGDDTPGTPGPAGQVKPGNQHAYDQMINAAAKKYGVDPLLIKAVMRQESDFDKGATSASNCAGLMQVSPQTQPDTGVSGNLYQPSVSINAGASYIKKMLTAAHGDVHKALLAYNAGPNAASDNAVPPGQDSSAGQYAAAVEGWYNDLKTKGEVNTTLGAKPGS